LLLLVCPGKSFSLQEKTPA